MYKYNPSIADWQDAETFMEVEAQKEKGRFCKCGLEITHGNSKNPWCSVRCPEYRRYLASKPRSRLAIETDKKLIREAFERISPAQRMDGLLGNLLNDIRGTVQI